MPNNHAFFLLFIFFTINFHISKVSSSPVQIIFWRMEASSF